MFFITINANPACADDGHEPRINRETREPNLAFCPSRNGKRTTVSAASGRGLCKANRMGQKKPVGSVANPAGLYADEFMLPAMHSYGGRRRNHAGPEYRFSPLQGTIAATVRPAWPG